MSSTQDPAKLKVVELRAELSKRGLDTKGNKPALVKRLKEALEEELKEELPDTSIADTSTEDLDTSQTSVDPVAKEKKGSEEKNDESADEVTDSQKNASPEPTIEPEKVAEVNEDVSEEPKNSKETTEPTEESVAEVSSEKEDDSANVDDAKENGEQDIKPQKSRWSSATEEPQVIESEESNIVEATEPGKEEMEHKGEKRRRSSASPERSQRRRSKSPIKEDEPPIAQDRVQLSWYDSDLHLQVDKESFLSAKPYHEGVFGFAWAGVRATHGVKTGKVCFEVKITEELKWEDFTKHHDKHRREQHKSTSKHKSEDDPKKGESEVRDKDEDLKCEDSQQENGDKAEKVSDNDVEMKEITETKVEAETKLDGEEKDSDASKAEAENKEATNLEQVEEQTPVQEPVESKEQVEPTEPLPTHLFRVGWSLLDSCLQLGEDKFSYGYESTGKSVFNKQFENYGIPFGVGDVIGSFLAIDDSGLSISYTVNGVSQSQAISIPSADIPENFVLFPHVLSRNYAFELNLGSKEESWFTNPPEYEDYVFLDKVEDKIPGPVRPENRSDCEVILMCGLPASGKTHWVREYVQSNPDKKYTVLGSTHFLEKMTISGDELKTKYKGSWNMLLEKLQKCINKLIETAALRRRNYIIDQPNVYPSAQRRKLRPFEGFKRRAVVVVVGDEEQAKRQSLQETQGGKDVPDSIVLDMKANMSLPQKGDWIDEVVFAGVDEEEAKAIVQKYNSQARETIGVQRRFSHRDDRHRWQNRRNDYRGGNYRDRSYHNNRYDRGPPRQGNWHPQRPGGWNRDRRDTRGPPMGGSRDWRNRGNGRDRGSRDAHGQVSNYNRNRSQPGRGSGGNWSANWSQPQGNWSNQAWGSQNFWGQGWSGQSNQNQWKYGGGNSQGYGGYSNWNYYGQSPQNWGSQGQVHSAGNSASGANQYGQYSQQDWAQYAQQYAQQGQTTTTPAQSTPQK